MLFSKFDLSPGLGFAEALCHRLGYPAYVHITFGNAQMHNLLAGNSLLATESEQKEWGILAAQAAALENFYNDETEVKTEEVTPLHMQAEGIVKLLFQKFFVTVVCKGKLPSIDTALASIIAYSMFRTVLTVEVTKLSYSEEFHMMKFRMEYPQEFTSILYSYIKVPKEFWFNKVEFRTQAIGRVSIIAVPTS